MSALEPVIGLEVHAQLSTATKIFSGSSAAFGAPPNTQTDPVCLGLPGALPVVNVKAVEFAMRLGLALGCEIRESNVFARKHYFYPDVPKNYQISQFDQPICRGGEVPIVVDGKPSTVALERIHLEEDAGKSLHDQTQGQTTLVDLNRAGVPLVEIVSQPVLRSVEEAGAYLTALRRLVRYLDICDGNMEEGSLRCDANVSVREVGVSTLGTKVEIKNMNSIRGVMAALVHEIERQKKAVADGERIRQETRLWDPDRNTTRVMRSKEEASDYRYFPDPDLPPVLIDEAWLERVRMALPELPAARAGRLVREFGVSADDAAQLSQSRAHADYFEQVVASVGKVERAGKLVSNWMVGEVARVLNERDGEIDSLGVSASGLAELIQLVVDGTVSSSLAKEVFEKMTQGGGSAAEIVERDGLRQISDVGEIDAQVRQILDSHPQQVQTYLDGKESVAAFFVGQLMKLTRGQANPKLANDIVRKALEERRG